MIHIVFTIGLLIAMDINIFVASGPLDLIISLADMLIFTGLTAFDTQRKARMAAQMTTEGDATAKFGIIPLRSSGAPNWEMHSASSRKALVTFALRITLSIFDCGALRLYLDFINKFLFMLRLFGRRR
jgi:uncharacterized protein